MGDSVVFGWAMTGGKLSVQQEKGPLHEGQQLSSSLRLSPLLPATHQRPSTSLLTQIPVPQFATPCR